MSARRPFRAGLLSAPNARLLGSFNHGSITPCRRRSGAQATAPGRQVIAMCGDGGFSMLMGDFLSVVQMKLPIKTVVFNNSVLGFVAMEMKAGGYLTDGTNCTTPLSRVSPKFSAALPVFAWKSRRRGRSATARFPLTARYWLTWSWQKKSWRSRRRSNWNKRKALACTCCARHY